MNLEDLAKKEQAEYMRNWRKKNPDKVRKSNHEYWKRRAQKRLADSLVSEKAEAGC